MAKGGSTIRVSYKNRRNTPLFDFYLMKPSDFCNIRV